MNPDPEAVASLPYLDQLLKLGGAGVGLAIVGWVAWQFWGATSTCWKERLTDWKGISEILDTLKTAISAFTQTSASRDRGAEAVARVLEAQTTAITEMRNEQRQTATELRGLREAFIAAGIHPKGGP